MNDIEKAIDILKEKLQVSSTGLTVGELNDQKRALDLAISALEKQIELNDYLNTLRKNKKYQIYDILSEFALEVENEERISKILLRLKLLGLLQLFLFR